MSKLGILFSGKKSSGKTSAGKFAFCYFINNKLKAKRFHVVQEKEEVYILDSFNNKKIYPEIPSDATKSLNNTYGVKMYSFADPLKEFCINVLGLSMMQCYGTNNDKETLTNISWESISSEIKEFYLAPNKNNILTTPTGYLTARQVMEVFGTHICRKLDNNCWARGLYQKISSDKNTEFAIITDGRFPNEISMGSEIGIYPFRLKRNPYNPTAHSECALDDFPLGEYYKIIENSKMSLSETQEILKDNLDELFSRHDIFK
jgi:hypothetical protein